MNRVPLKSIVAGLAASVVLTSSAMAGGFNRGSADTDILFETERFAQRSGVTVVAPSIDIVSIGGTATSGFEARDYIIPSVALKAGLTENVACAGTYTTPYGGHTDYSGLVSGGALLGRDPTSTLQSVSQEFVVREFGATCSAGFEAGKGKLSLLGGVFFEDLEFEQIIAAGTRSFKLDGESWGYRFGAAYEIPEIALRAQVMYRSATDYSLGGTVSLVSNGTVLVPNASATAKFPQSVEAKVQSGIAPGWLAFGSVKWTDWSVFQTLNYNAGGARSLNFFWEDGWTVTGGVAHRFNDMVAGTVSLTWDKGVGTGHDLSTDRITVATGLSYTPRSNFEIRAGAAYIFVKGGVQNFTETGVPGGSAPIAGGGKIQDDSHALAGSFSLKITW